MKMGKRIMNIEPVVKVLFSSFVQHRKYKGVHFITSWALIKIEKLNKN